MENPCPTQALRQKLEQWSKRRRAKRQRRRRSLVGTDRAAWVTSLEIGEGENAERQDTWEKCDQKVRLLKSGQTTRSPANKANSLLKKP